MPVGLSSVGHRFAGSGWLFRGLSLTLTPGRVYSLTGPSGAGKSTLLALLAGWITPAEGVISVPVDARTGWVFQNPHGTPNRTARDHVAFPLLARGQSVAAADAHADSLLDRFGLLALADRPFRALSGGEAQRLMLARGLAAGPDLFLIDEPTAQLDRETARGVNRAIGAIAAHDTIVVVATHDEDTRAACTDHIVLRREPSDEPRAGAAL
ncbi:ATP-binding cassette domain-containing protein [Leifsonia shinshuensis]|uniref:ATP-binding cassette domain-containing protein n=1 Tax=Leifsonia shinshuensis TaxID=150026 RepID=A0A7G6YEN5_9MICO|nr:ATP-binding cassette domain-containing protein [Leifsonia shinshuensis]QNE36950.1 ATP-binding cassette domain-containing protein [Leifsonia shinshuensis]